MRVSALIRQYIEVDPADLPRQVYTQMLSALTVENPEKQTAMREKLWMAEEMPESILLLYQSGQRLYIPRGFIHSFVNGMRAYGVEIEWNDQRRVYDYFDLGLQSTVQLRDYQEPMCDALVAGECGVVAADTGAGKTEVALAAISKISQPTIIIVEKATLAEQWRERIRSRLGIEPGYIGENKFELAPITVALRQTLWARVAELSSMATMVSPLSPRRLFFDLWGCVVVDEVHHVPAATVTDLVQRFSARYRWGVSATPERDPLTFPITQVVVGPVLYEAPPEALAGALMTPKIHVLTSGFDFDYHPTEIIDRIDAETGETVISAKTGKPIQKRIQNNYSDMLEALCTDPERNDMIARKVVEEANAGHHALIISRRKVQLEALKQAIYAHADVDLPVMELFGREPGSRKLEVEERINASERSILLSTVAEEGLDIPKLDRCVLAYPFRNVEVVRQPIGRILRKHPAKTDAVVIDIRDKEVGLLASQYRERAQLLYGKRGWEIEHV